MRESYRSDLSSWHPQRERSGAGDERRGSTTIVERDYSTIALTAKGAANRPNTKSERLDPQHDTLKADRNRVDTRCSSTYYVVELYNNH